MNILYYNFQLYAVGTRTVLRALLLNRNKNYIIYMYIAQANRALHRSDF